MLDPTTHSPGYRKLRRLSGHYSFENGYHGLELTPDGDAFRILERNHERLLIAAQPGSYPEIYVLDSDGLWNNDPADFLSIHQRTITEFATEIARLGSQDQITGLKAERVGRAVQDCISRKSIGKAEEARKSIGSLVAQIPDLSQDDLPYWATVLNRCRLEDVDSDTTCIAAPNGVVDLNTGRLLDADSGSRRLLTRRYALPDPYRRGAAHTRVEQLFSHMPSADAAYLSAELGYCLWGAPSRRVLFLIGEGGGGKTTLTNAIRASFGPLVSRPNSRSISKDPNDRPTDNDAWAEYFVTPYRFAIFEEVADVQIKEERVKERSGDVDEITYSRKYENPVRRRPTATMTFVSNDTPKQIGLKDKALRDRMRILPYHPVPAEQQDGSLKFAWQGQDEEAQKMRQAFVAYLVNFCLVHPLGQPPTPPPSQLETVQEWADAELGEFGQWVKANLIEAPSDFAVIEEVWRAAKQQFSTDRADTIHGVRRSGFPAYARSIIPKLPKASRARSRGLAYGWAGWRLLSDDDLPFVDEAEMELDVSADGL